jgi:type II secretory pathway pseudopilin PulG
MFQVLSSKFQKKGFTIIELLVVTGIIIILSVVMFADYHTGQEHLALQRSAYKVAQDLRQIQEMAMSAKEIGSEGGEFYPTGGFGIYFDINEPGEYILFADCDNDGELKPGKRCGVSPNDFQEMIEEVQLESKIEISDLFPISAQNELHITFSAPDPTIKINDDINNTIAEIFLSTLSNETKIIKVNTAGLINVE